MSITPSKCSRSIRFSMDGSVAVIRERKPRVYADVTHGIGAAVAPKLTIATEMPTDTGRSFRLLPTALPVAKHLRHWIPGLLIAKANPSDPRSIRNPDSNSHKKTSEKLSCDLRSGLPATARAKCCVGGNTKGRDIHHDHNKRKKVQSHQQSYGRMHRQNTTKPNSAGFF